MEASLAATGMFDVLATNAVRFMIDSSTPPISTFSCKAQKEYQSITQCVTDSFFLLHAGVLTLAASLLQQALRK